MKGKNHPMYGKSHSEESKLKMSISQKTILRQGAYHPMYGVPRPEGAGKSSIKLQVFDKETNKTTIYSSISEAATNLNINPRRISMYLSRNQQKPYKNRYVFTKIDL